MKKEALITAMKTSISDVLETMFFLPVDFSDPGQIDELWGNQKDQIMIAKLNFEGPFSGNAVFYIPQEPALSITADFMGENKEKISDLQVEGTVNEITNMLVGNTFSLYDPQAVFNLATPGLVRFEDIHKDSPGVEITISIVIETLENHMAFQMNFKKG